MKLFGMVAAAALALGLAGASHANTITAQGNDGDIYSVDVTTGVVSPLVPLSKQGTSVFSPNGLGFNGAFFRSEFSDPTEQNTLYVGDVPLGVLPADGFAIASGDVSGQTYYYVDGMGNFRSADFSVPGLDISAPLSLEDGNTISGDLAILGGTAYVSYSDATNTHKFASINLATNSVVSTVEVDRRYAGIAFTVDGNLYGFEASPTDGSGASNGIEIFQIGLDGSETGTGVFLNGVPGGVLLTDAARSFRFDTEIVPIPLPAGAWLLLGGLGALAAVRRRRKAAA